MMPQKRSERLPLVELLSNSNIGKIAHNMKFEHSWAKEKLGVEVQGWEWDTMLMSHVQDNRQGITSLKYQTYVQMGIIDYSSMIEPYLEGIEKKNGNSLNRVPELISTHDGKQQLLKYNALDAVYEYRLWKLQESDLLPF
jgi:coenzyme F420-reducing hydrogenase alpha subunit